MATKIASINRDYTANDMHRMWSVFYREQRQGLPHSRSEAYLRQAEKRLAADIAQAVASYNNGLITASQFISVLAQFEGN